MDLKQIISKKKELELLINAAIAAFEMETEVEVGSIGVKRLTSFYDEDTERVIGSCLLYVSVNCSIPHDTIQKEV